MEQQNQDAAVLVRAVRSRAGPVQLASRPVCASRRELEQLLGLDYVLSLYRLPDAVVARENDNFAKYPLRRKPASFNLDAAMRTLVNAGGGANH
jgi:hypothetical protein